MPKRKQEKRQIPQSTHLVALLKGGALALVCAVVVLAGVALLESGGLVSRTVADGSVAAACALGALTGGLYVQNHCERGFLLVGIGAGMLEWLLMLIIGAIAFGGFGGVGEMVGSAVGCLSGGLLAGVMRAMRGGGRKRGK